MSKPIIRLPQRARRGIQRPDARPDSPAVYIGTMPGFQDLPAIELYNLLQPVGVHPVGSTVSRRTLEKHGFRVTVTATSSREYVATSAVDPRPLQVA